MRNFKKDDIVVCINKDYIVTKEGDIWKIKKDGSYNNYDGGGCIEERDLRYATEDEINHYNNGIRNIKKIPKEEIEVIERPTIKIN